MESDSNESLKTNESLKIIELGINTILKHHIASDAVTTDKIEDESITTCKLQDGSITKDKLSGDIISLLNRIDDIEDEIDNINITTDKLENNSITNEKLKVDCIENKNLVDKIITNNKLADNSVNTNNIVDNSINYRKLTKECFRSDHIANNSITHEKLSEDCVSSINIMNECITNEKLTDECIYTVNLTDGCITNRKLMKNSVETHNLMDNCVTSKKLSPNSVNAINIIDGSITNDKLSINCINSENIIDESITHAKLSFNSVSEYNICNNSITNDKLVEHCIERYNLADEIITNEKLTEKCIDTANLIDNSVTINKLSEEILEKINNIVLSNNVIETKHLTKECITNEKMGLHSVTGKNIAENSIDNTKLCAKSVKSSNICDGNITKEKLSQVIVDKLNIFDNFIDTYSFETHQKNEIPDNSISHEKLTDGCIENNNLSRECVENINLAQNSVKSSNIDEGSIINRHLSMHCIKSDNLDIKCVQNENMGLLSVGHENLKIESVETDNIKKGSITLNVLSQEVKNLLSGENNVLNTTSLPVNISHSDAPDINQVLVATSSTSATWQTINHDNILNIGKHAHEKIDEHIDNTGSVHGIEGNVVGTFDLQILTNKTLDDITNIVTSDNLHSETTTINIRDSSAPSLNQVLIAKSPYKAIWETINHKNISNIGTHSHIQIDEHIESVSNVHGITGQVVGTTDDQILTNKIIDDRTNEITADNLHSESTTINVVDSPAPTINQTLIATSSSKATWQTINHDNIRNIGKYGHDEIDKHIDNKSNVHGIMGNVVGTTDEQILKNKTLDDRSNKITTDNLHSVTNTINISNSAEPLSNQVLITTSPDVASWQYIDHKNISNIGKYTHEQIDKYIDEIELTLSDQSSTEQTLTNKTLNDRSNYITCDNLHSATTTININQGLAPTINQALIAISPTEANWQTIDHKNLENIGTNTHAQIDTHIGSNSGIHGVIGNVVGTTDIQTLTNKTFADSIDNTKKMNFVLTPITTATTIALMVPSSSTTLVGIDSNQTLTNKILNSTTNVITCDNLRSSTGIITINTAAAPVINQALIALSDTTASWQTINHTNLSNIGTNTHSQIDTHIAATSGAHGITGNFVGTTDDQILTNKTIISSNTFADSTDNTKKMNFVLTPVTTGTTIALLVPNLSTTLVGTDSNQILTNKTLDSTTNVITCDNLRSATTVIGINTATAPSINQALIATSGTAASWQTINHTNLSNIGTNTHAQIDTHIAATSGVHGITGNIVGTTDVQTITNKTIISTNTFADSTDNTKKMNFVLTPITTATTIALTVPSSSTTLVGIDSNQTLTNKTLNSTTNIITCDNLRSSTGVIGINTATAPTANQALVATSNTAASWQTINHANISNIGTNSHAQIDTHIAATSGAHGITGNVVGTSDVQTLTNKTLDSTTNNITSDALHSATTTINTALATAPTVNQALIATSGTAATWQTINHTNLSNIGTNTHSQIDTHIAASSGAHGITGNFVGTSDAQTITNKTFADSVDNTKKMNFVLTPLTTATTVALAIPTSSTTLVGIDSNQTLTNKTLNSTTNVITCDNLRSATTVIGINTATAPTVNQALIATSSTAASWQTVNHTNLTNIGTNTHAQIDTHIGSISGVHGTTGNIVGTTDTQTLTNKTFADSVDNTKKMNFILTPLTTATTVALTIPTASTTLVGIDSNQTLTNKTLNSTTNIITCDNLRSATTVIGINTATAPIVNQALIATSSTAANWQTINHTNLSNIGTNTHAQIDTHLAATSGAHGITGNFVGTTDIQTLTNKTIISTNTFADSTDNTKKMNFVLTPITTATTIALTVPSSSTTLVGIDSNQTLTNKTLNSTTNIITCDNLRSATGIITINTATAPTVNQSLIATSGTAASWQTINHTNLSNIGTNTHAQIDAHIASTSGAHGITGNIVGTSDVQTLTNKTLDSTTNNITCDALHSATTTVNVELATAPTVNQALIATSGTAATWQTINHTNLTNIGTNTHAQIDTHLAASAGVHGITGNVVGTTDAQTITNKTFADSLDGTKKMNFVLTPLTTATTVALTIPTASTTLVGIDSNQTLTNKTFADSVDNTKKMNFVLTPLTTATTVALTIPTVSTTLVGIDSNQTLTNKTIISSNTFADSTDNTKKMNFVLTPITTATTIALTVPSTSTTLVGIDSNQTLTNKTLNSTTNVITCDNLRSATTVIGINTATAPSVNQALIATSGTAASWQTINHTNLSNIGTNTHAQIDTHLAATSGTHGITGNFVGTTDSQTLTNKTIISSNTFADSVDNTKKMNFVLTPITTATTIALTVPAASTTLVGLDSNQTLTNKTLNSTTNVITCDNLRSATTVIGINTATAPSANQALIATSSTAASWQTINHTNLSNIGTNTHAQIDTHLAATSGSHGITGNFVGTTDIQTLTNKTIVSSNTFADSIDNTKKMNFVLIPITTATTIALTVPAASTTLVGIDSNQTLTNKTLNSTTNVITCDNLRSATTVIGINTATAPTVNQALIATSGTAASWQTINHTNLSNIGTNTHAQIDTHLAATSGVHGITGSIVGTSDVQTLTNKTLDSTTNNITCDALHSATTTINVELATAPTINQALIATSSTAATWQTINHTNLSNIGTNTHAQIDTHIAAISGVHGITGNFVGTTDAQTLTNKTFADSIDNTKKMNFVLTPLTTATTVALTIPTASTTIVGIDSNQTLTNKTLNSITNVITCDNLRSATTVIGINTATAPSANQALIATSSTAANWQTINHANLTNIGTNTHAQIDTHLAATSGAHGITGNFVGTTDIQTLTNKTIVSSNTFADSTDNTKKMNFVLTPITTATTIALTVPSTSTTLVGIDSNQTLTNKTLNSTTNIITCDNLRSATTVIGINTATAPSINQALIATSGTAANWQTINHTNLSNIGTNTHAQIDTHLAATSGTHGITGNFVGTTDSQTLTNKTIISTNTFADSTDNTKKMNFVLTPITTATTIALTVPAASTTLVGIDSNQTLTNKTLNSTTNVITCDNLRSATTVIGINTATAPSANQALIATSSTAAAWQTINHANLTNIGTNTHAQIDSFITSTNSSLATMVSLTGTQTITNKTLDSATNNITCDALHSLTTTINVDLATAPTANQALIATSSTAAKWQTINHTNLTNIGTNTHAQIDTHLAASTGVHGITGNVVGTTDVQTITNKIFDASNSFPAGATSTLMNYYAYASTTVTYTTNAYVIVDSMSLNPPAGTYYVSCSLCVNFNSTARTANFGFCNTATITPIANTLTQLLTGSTAAYLIFNHTAIVTCDGTNGLDVIINAGLSGALTVTVKYRSFSALKIG